MISYRTLIIGVLTLTLGACHKDPQPETPPPAPPAAPPDSDSSRPQPGDRNSTWIAISKFCGSTQIPMLKNDHFIFLNDRIRFEYHYVFEDNEKLTCYRTLTYTRLGQSISRDNKSVHIVDSLIPYRKREICISKADGTHLSDELKNWEETKSVLSLLFSNERNEVSLTNIDECPGETLTFEMKLKWAQP